MLEREVTSGMAAKDFIRQKVWSSATVDPRNRELYLEWAHTLLAESLSFSRVLKYSQVLMTFERFLRKPFADATRRDIEDAIIELDHVGYRPHYLHDIKVTVRKFYKWLRRVDEYPEEVKWIHSVMTANSLPHTTPSHLETGTKMTIRMTTTMTGTAVTEPSTEDATMCESTPYDSGPSALFVDWDNILAGLADEAAIVFSRWPSRWMPWIEGIVQKNAGASCSSEHRLLLRRCYLNPSNSRLGQDRMPRAEDAREFLIGAGFSLVDCPTLTTQGKNGADIRMTIEILDALAHKTTFRWFVLMSGDSDFTSVLLRLREFNRRTVVITSQPIARAYRGAADHVIGFEQFAAEGLGVPGGFRPPSFGDKEHSSSRRGGVTVQ